MTMNTGHELISRLSAGVRPQAAGEMPAVETDRFRDLLARAEQGQVTSGLEVTAARGIEGQVPQELLAELGPLVDRAQARGASRALVVTDEATYELDVLRRRIESVVDPAQQQQVMTGIDAVLFAGGASEEDAPALAGPLLLPDAGIEAARHEGLLRALDPR